MTALKVMSLFRQKRINVPGFTALHNLPKKVAMGVVTK
jgi:hypothetical protein